MSGSDPISGLLEQVPPFTETIPQPESKQQSTKPLQKMGFSTQVGAFSQLDNAVRLENSLKGLGVDAYYFRHDDGLYKVRFGNHREYYDARSEAEQLQQSGVIDKFFIVIPEDYAVAKIAKSGHGNLRDELVKTAQRFLGVPYRWGGEDRKNGFDCSGLTMVSYRLNGLNLPRNSRMQFNAGRSVAKNRLQKGDLVFFATKGGTRVTHVGMYAGNNQFIHAPRTGKTVRFASLANKFWKRTYVGGRSYL
ncbi:C40 family peptidase [Malonomonas rubra]|uniref:C40 family peptidase n=1 Tax=Malonomonas rubra TaxID=57040 RepID=UPI0026EF637E|nr:C40 family peptidase [Malonomonas rubra]